MKMAGSNPGHFVELVVLTRFLPRCQALSARGGTQASQMAAAWR
jgi:hypothetical protein